MSTPSKFSNTELDATLLNTPMPKASSTVRRKSTLENKYLDLNVLEDNFVRPSCRETNMLLKSDDSSLGILNNISNLLGETSGLNNEKKKEYYKLDAEQELARKLLRKCSNIKGSTSFSDSNKEDDVNIETLRDCNYSSDQMVCNSFLYNNDNKLKNDNSILSRYSSVSSMKFKPDEITRRSTEINEDGKFESPFTPKSVGGISFDTVVAEQMAIQLKDEKFYSISEDKIHLLTDEPSWKQNCTYDPLLKTNSEKEYFDFSCFSGIIGEVDISVESNIGRKMSVGEFFKRKSENTGNLSNYSKEKPSLGLPVKSPQKKSQLIPLIDSTIADGSLAVGEKEQILTNTTQNVNEEYSIMSLSSIAHALQNFDDCTPRRLVDQLIMAKKKRKELERNNYRDNTYTLSSSERHSMPVTPNVVKIKDDNVSSKFSLDSKTVNETLETKKTLPRMLTFSSNLDLHTKDILDDIPQMISLKKEEESSTSFQQQLDTDEIQLMNMQSILKDNKLSMSNMKSDKSGMERKEQFKEENISYTSKVDCSSTTQQLSTVERSSSGTMSQLQDTILCRNGQEICCCIVGISREADIELTNTGDKWIICLFSAFQLQGDKQNIVLHLPQDKILINPNSTRSVKIGIKVTKMINPVIVILNITTTDMVTGRESIIKHMIYVESEELQVNILTPFKELDFGSIIENTIKTLSIQMQNKNNMVLPVTLSIVNDGSQIFSINNLQSDLMHELKPRELFTAVVQCEGTSSLLASELSQNELVSVEAKLLIQIKNKKDDAVMIKEIPLFVKIGKCKIQLVDTELPIEIHKKKIKYFTIVNLGKLPLPIAAFIVQDEYSSNHVEDFSIKPESLMLQCNTTDKFLITFKPRHCDIRDRHVKIKLTVGNNNFYYSVIGKQNIEAEYEHHLRCDTPQQLNNAISPNSPQSVQSSRSGRNSPISSVSGSTVAGDQIPIKSTHAALIWGSIKTNKSDIKEFTIRNMSENRIKLQVHISDNNSSFLFLKDHQITSPNIMLLLHRMESKTLSVVFCPRHIGAATGKIIFSYYEAKKEENKSRPTKAIFLYGYGGFGKIVICNIVKDIGEKMWLPLGKLSSGSTLNANIELKNIGDLCSYAKVKLTPKAIYPSMLSSWQVNPTELLLEPKDTKWISLEFQPKKEDLVLLQQRSNISHVGTINIIYGDEPTRWRIRRLYNKIKSSSDLNRGESEPFRNIVYPLCKVFPEEQTLSDLNLINDSIHNLSDLCHGVRQHEIMLTVETNADESISMMHDSADESQRFYSLCSDNSHTYESSGKSFLPLETLIGDHEVNERQQIYDDYFTVNPDFVTLIPSKKNEAIVTILSSSRVAQPYMTALSNLDVLSILPAEGMIPAGKEFPLKIKCKQKVQRSFEATLEIYTKNHKQDVTIKVAVC